MVNSKKKGAKGERAVSHLLNQWSGLEFQRTPASGGLRWKKSDNISGDIICSEPNYIFPFSIEVKFHRDIDFSDLLRTDKKGNKIALFWEQAKDDAKRAKKLPWLFMRYNGLPKNFHFIVMRSRHFKELMNYLDLSYPYFRTSNGLTVMSQDVLLKGRYKKIVKRGKKILGIK